MSRKRWFTTKHWLLGGGAFVVLLSGRLWALPVMHEFFEPDPAEDIRLGATTRSGRMPAAIDTPSGLVSAPGADSALGNAVYGGTRMPTSADASYRLDRLTSAPNRVEYDEPFRPAVLPFKRSYAFDSVNEDFSLAVAATELTVLGVGGQALPGEEPFFAELAVDLEPGRPSRIPSVGPGARALFLESEPALPLELLADGAENWFLRSPRAGRARVTMQLAWAARVVPPNFGRGGKEVMARLVKRLPEGPSRAARRVIETVGLDAEGPLTTLTRLVAYFRAFQASEVAATANSPGELYVELSLAQRGVCRHRAYAFLLTALELGIPTRMIHNEAHAWVEVSDGSGWYRIDLGGAPVDLSLSRPPGDVPAHRPPLEPFAWPGGSQPGAELSARLHGGASSWPSALSGNTPSPSSVPPLPSPPRVAGSEQQIELAVASSELRRGTLVAVSGRVRERGQACTRARVDIYLAGVGEPRLLGSLPSDGSGAFHGQVSLPLDAGIGRQEIFARLGAPCRAP
ncbi:MAG TPA: transglutaminase domain-containing protein [Polyangiaceae bacterium]|nr:transglutaminase domain-containing protein [Polyangiaceae bacterium]